MATQVTNTTPPLPKRAGSGTLRRLAIIVAFAALATLAVVVSGSPAGAVTQSAADDEIVVVSLGDSYTAGTGAGNYYGEKGCFQSYDSYPWQYVDLLEDDGLNASIWHHACSDHRLADIEGQVDAAQSQGTASEADIVVLSIGGNDFDFESIVLHCLVRNGFLFTCPNALEDANDLRDHVREQTSSVLQGFETEFPNAQEVILVGYPDLTSPSCARAANTQLGEMQLDYDTIQRELVAELNRDLGIGSDLNYQFVSLHELYRDRGPCGTGSISGGDIDDPPDRWVRRVLDGGILPYEAYHPTKHGHHATAELLFDLEIHKGLNS